MQIHLQSHLVVGLESILVYFGYFTFILGITMVILYSNYTTHCAHSASCEVFRQAVWMRHWGADSSKPTLLWSNSVSVAELSLGKLTKDRVAFA